MSIKLTKELNGEKVTLDLISVKGKTVVRNKSFKEAKVKGVTKKSLKEAGIQVQSDILKL